MSKTKIIIPIIVVLLLIGGIAWEFMHFANTPKNTYLKVNNKQQNV